MCQTLFTIPRQIAGLEIFGAGWLLILCGLYAAFVVVRSLRGGGWNSQTWADLQLVAMVAFGVGVIGPFLLTKDGLPVRGYGVMFAISVVAGVALCVWRAQRAGIDPEIIYSLAFWMCISGLVGARLFYVVEYWDQFQRPTLGQTLGVIINFTQGGLVVYGSLLAAGAALAVFVHRHKLPGLALADLIVPGIVLGAALGRIGCFMDGCCYGGPTDLPWGVQFPTGSPAYIDEAVRGQLFLHGLQLSGDPKGPAMIDAVQPGSAAEASGLKPGDRIVAINEFPIKEARQANLALMEIYGAGETLAIRLFAEEEPHRWTIAESPPRSLPVHPTQIYSLIDALLLLGLMLAYEPYKRRAGELTAMVLVLHPISRFLLEVIRTDEGAIGRTGMTIAQLISLGIFAGGLALWYYLSVRRPPEPQWPATAWARAGA